MIHDPLLALDDIQGIVLPGFLKPYQALLCFSMPRPTVHSMAQALLRALDSGQISNGLVTLEDRERHRNGAPAEGVLTALAFTAPGLDKLCYGLSANVPGAAYSAGMSARAGLLGDPPPASWTVKWKPAVDAMLVVAGNDPHAVRRAAEATRQAVLDRTDLAFGKYPLQIGRIPSALHPGREHFGFADGISQPGIRGYIDSGRTQWLTPRRLPPDDPEHGLYGLPGQHLVWPGEFVLGYPGASPDPALPGPVRLVPSWMHNGSFLVYRRLQQHVDRFHATMRSEAARLDQLPGFRGMTPERLAAMLVGRWPSGAPLLRTPAADCPGLGRDRHLNNDFRYDDDTPPRAFRAPRLANAPRAQADPLGLVCPLASHIRKVNLRDQASDVGGASATQSRRILRVGVPYDDSRPAADGRPAIDDRGLLFLSIQASIEDQFEFLQARWINSRSRPRGPGGNDMLVGQNVANADGERRCTIFGDGMAQADVVARENFVTMTGGAYFFVPALSTLRRLLDGTLQP